jgi:hypothetical protein
MIIRMLRRHRCRSRQLARLGLVPLLLLLMVLLWVWMWLMRMGLRRLLKGRVNRWRTLGSRIKRRRPSVGVDGRAGRMRWRRSVLLWAMRLLMR